MNTATRRKVGLPDPRPTSFVHMSAIWVRTVARSWRSGLRDLYSRIP